MDNEFEVVSYEQLRHFSVFLNRITYRNFHFHGAFELMMVLEGCGKISIGSEKLPLEPGHLVLINPYEAHEISGTDLPVLTLIFSFLRTSSEITFQRCPIFVSCSISSIPP